VANKSGAHAGGYGSGCEAIFLFPYLDGQEEPLRCSFLKPIHTVNSLSSAYQSKLLSAMDPMTALSLAGNVVQFIEFGTRLLSTTKELYRSSTGSLTVHDEIELVTTDLSILVAKLKQNRTDEPDDFQKICDEAASVATEILTKLGTMKVKKEGKYRELKSFRAAVKQVWSHRELEKLEARLGRIQEAIKTRVLFSLGSAQPKPPFEQIFLTLIVRDSMWNRSECRPGLITLINRLRTS
jgi:hypothetical protein